MSSIYNNVQVTQLLDPILAQTTRTSDYIDLQGYHDHFITVNIGFALDSLTGSRYWTIQLQEGATTGSFSNVADSDTHNGTASYVLNSSALDEQAYNFSYKGNKRYIRVIVTNTGTHSVGTPMSIIALFGKPSVAPVA